MDFKARVVVLAATVLCAGGTMDWGHVPSEKAKGRLPTFVDPGIRPPSYIFAKDQYWPPYDISVSTMDPAPGCTAHLASVCAVQNAIRLVTRARVEACPMLQAGGVQRQQALANISNGFFSAPGTVGFGVFAFDRNGTIIADALKPGLVGQRFDGRMASWMVAQFTLLDYVNWVVSWGGGWVPHHSTRFAPGAVDLAANPPPAVESTAYVEACPSGERLAVAYRRDMIPEITNCAASSNAFCAINNVNRMVGGAVSEFLNSHTAEELYKLDYRMALAPVYRVSASFYCFRIAMNDLGFPGPDPQRNPGFFPNNPGTVWVHSSTPTLASSAYLFMGRNLSMVGGMLQGMDRGEYLHMNLNVAAYKGGSWRDYQWNTAALGNHHKVSLVLGMVWNNSASYIGAGTTHMPSPRIKGPVCTDCSAYVSLPCSHKNIQYLSAHATLEILTPTGAWSRISYDKWFGAMHASAVDFTYFLGTWPLGFYVAAFDYNGTCVADGLDPSNIGKQASEVFSTSPGKDLIHSNRVLAADAGGGWVSFSLADGTVRLTYINKLAKNGRLYYMAVSYTKAALPMEPTCTAQYAEPCSERQAQGLLGIATAEMLSARSEADLLNVLGSIANRTGRFSPASTGDFVAYVYDDSWKCPANVQASASTTGIMCPPEITPDRLYVLSPLAQDGGWATVTGAAKVAYVARVTYSTLGSPVYRDFILVTYVTDKPGPPTCASDAQCPKDATCAPTGRCTCNDGFRTDFKSNSTVCGQLKPASMTCTDVRGQDCTGVAPGMPCPPCTAGFYCPAGSPSSCPAGQYCAAASVNPALCPSGTSSASSRAAGLGSCLPCSTGTFALSGGQTACEACPVGKFSVKSGASSCDLCKIGDFQPAAGMSECNACEGILAGSTTPFLGVSEASGCICPEAWYLPKGGNKCLDCPAGMSCKLGSDMKNLDLLSGTFPVLLPRYWSSISNPLSVFSCSNEAYCPGGPPGTCAAHSTSQSCAHCEDNYYWDGQECSKCASTGASSFIYPALPILLIPCIITGLYATSMNANINKWRGWENQFATGGFILLNYFQIIDIVGSTQARTPQKMIDLYAGFQFFTEFIVVFKPSCAGYNTLSSSMLTKSLTPVGLAICCLVLYGLSFLLSKIVKRPKIAMEKNCLFNIYGGIMYTFFGAIAAMSIDLFKCSVNPNGSKTMISDPSVTCYNSDEWNGMLVVAIISTIVYVVGVLLGFVFVLHAAKTRYWEKSFRQRWMFLFVKYQHGAYWWGLVYLSRNFMVNLSLVIFPVAMYQCTSVMIISLVYLSFVALVWPYRSDFCNRAEVFCTMSVVINASVMSAFALRDDLNTQTSSVDIASVVIYLPTVTCAAVLGYLLYQGIQIKFKVFRGRSYIERDSKNVKDLAKSLSESFTMVAGISTEDIEELLLFLADLEIYYLRNVDLVLRSEFAAKEDTSKQFFQAKRLTAKKLEGKSGSKSQSRDEADTERGFGAVTGPASGAYHTILI